MASFGPALQLERQRRGLSLDDVARETRLARRYLRALETESLDTLPGRPYNRAYLRTYADYLGLDADRLVRDYDLEVSAQAAASRVAVEPDALATMHVAAQHRAPQTPAGRAAFATRVRVSAVSGVVIVVLVGAMWWGARYFTQRTETVPVDAVGSPVLVGSGGVTEAVGVSAQTPEPLAPAEPRPRSEPEPVAAGTSAEEAGSIDVPAAPLSVESSGVGTDVVDRQLVGPSDTFAVGTRVAFWTRVRGGRPGDAVRHVWLHQGRMVAAVNLPIGSANWRTHSQRTLAPGAEGDWVVEARDAGGRVLARHEFRCEPS
jgi:cytoskeletal protein RodZ